MAQAPNNDHNAMFFPAHPTQRHNQFASGLCDCPDTGLCIYSCFCNPCLTAANSARMDGHEAPFCFCCYPGNGLKTRMQAKAMLGINGSFCTELLTVMCCPVCSEVQVAHSIRSLDKNPTMPLKGIGAGNSTVVLPAITEASRPNFWSTSLFGCFDDFGICLKGLICPCCLSADNSAFLDVDTPCLLCCYPSNAWKNRAQTAGLSGINESKCTSCLTAAFCIACSECQVARELNIRAGLAQNNANLHAVVVPGTVYMASAPPQQAMIVAQTSY